MMQRKPKIGDQIRECRNGYSDLHSKYPSEVAATLSNPFWVSEIKNGEIVGVQCHPYRPGAFDFAGVVRSFIFI